MASSNQALIALLLVASYIAQQANGRVNISVTSAKMPTDSADSDEMGLETFVNSKSSVTLECRLKSDTPLTNAKITWNHPDNETSIEESRFNRSPDQISSDKKSLNSTLVISSLSMEDIGTYKCMANNISGQGQKQAEGHITSLPMISLSEKSTDIAVRVGESIRISCDVIAYPKAESVIWLKDNVKYSNGSELIISEVKLEHRGNYKCKATNNGSDGKPVSNSYAIFLRVKNPNDFLVPLIVIVLEIVVLVAIVAIYEIMMMKKRKQAASDQDKTD